MKEYSFDSSDFDYDRIINQNKDDIIETTNFITILQACKETLEHSRMISIIGDPGYGKTKALTYFASKTDNVHYITVMKCMSSKVFYTTILQKIGFKNIHEVQNVYYIIDSIGYYLKESKSKHLIIIDEAGKLTHQNLLFLHDLRDSIKDNTGIVLAAPKYFETKILKQVENNIEGIPELSRRMNAWVELYEPTYEEKYAYCEYYGVKSKALMNYFVNNTTYKNLDQLRNALNNFGLKVIRDKTPSII